MVYNHYQQMYVDSMMKAVPVVYDGETARPLVSREEVGVVFDLTAGYVGSAIGESGVRGLSAIKRMSNLNPNNIRFSQSSVNGSQEIIESMMKNGWKGDPIDVVRMADGGLTTIDNTRVVAARAAEIDVQAVIHNADDLLPKNLIDRFTTKKGVPTTWGEAIELRIGKQNSNFRNSNPFGSFKMERIR
jgi:hypothetical protein